MDKKIVKKETKNKRIILVLISFVVFFLYTFGSLYFLRVPFIDAIDKYSFFSFVIDLILIIPYLFLLLHFIRSDKNSNKYIILAIISAITITVVGLLFFYFTFDFSIPG